MAQKVILTQTMPNASEANELRKQFNLLLEHVLTSGNFEALKTSIDGGNVKQVGVLTAQPEPRSITKDAEITPAAAIPDVAAHDIGGADHNADTLANLNTKVSDATLDDSADPRPPNGAAGGDLSVTYPDPVIAAAAVTAAKALAFVSAEQTGTGAPQNIAHGLGAVPALILVSVTEGHDGAAGQGIQMADITEGAHDGTNVIVTCTSGARFKVLAWA